MIHINVEGESGLGKPKWGKIMKVAQFAVAPQTLLMNKKQNQKIFKVVKKVALPHTLLMNKKQNQKAFRFAKAVIAPHTLLLNKKKHASIGLGKSKILKKIKLKNVVKQVGKVGKIAIPIVAGMIPVGGGVASSLTSKIVNSGAGKAALKLGRSKVGSAVLSQAGVNLPSSKPTATAMPVKKKKGFSKISPKKKAVAPKNTVAAKPKGKFPIKFKKKKTAKTLAIGSKGEDVKVLQEQLGIKPDGDFGPKTQQALEQSTGQTSISTDEIQTPAQTLAIGSKGEDVKELQEQLGIKPDGIFGAKTQQALEKATGKRKISTRAIQAEPMDEAEPQGELTPIKPFEEIRAVNPTTAAPKNNTMLYVGGAVALAGVVYLATRKE
jgi:peptidoglycan hydrolase-like protein with peptidoglycan-binding domain